MCMYDSRVYSVQNGFVFSVFCCLLRSVLILLCNGHRFSQKHDAHDDRPGKLYLLLLSLFLLHDV